MNNFDPENNKEHRRQIIFGSCFLTFIQYKNANNINPKQLSREEFFNILSIMGDDSHGIAFQILECPIDFRKNIIKHSIDANDFSSALILLSATLEEDVNGFLRIACLAKGYTHKQITSFISDISIKAKVDLVLPSLGCHITEQYKNAINELFPLRNKIVHGKAIPAEFTVSHEKESSYENNQAKAKELITRYSVKKIQNQSHEIQTNMLNTIPELKEVVELFNKNLTSFSTTDAVTARDSAQPTPRRARHT